MAQRGSRDTRERPALDALAHEIGPDLVAWALLTAGGLAAFGTSAWVEIAAAALAVVLVVPLLLAAAWTAFSILRHISREQRRHSTRE